MLTLRPANERGHANHGWLDTYHTFSFANYHDPAHMGFGPLRVINDDYIAAGKGFGTHGHRDMEIVTYPLAGAVAHKDSMGSQRVIEPGNVQRMSAGHGVLHSEFNPLANQTTHILQIWIEPNARNIEPEYEERRFPAEARRGKLCPIVSPDGADGSMVIHQDARLYAGLFDGAETARLPLAPGRDAWVHVALGSVTANGQKLGAGDGLAISQEAAVELTQGSNAEVLVFDLLPNGN